MPVDDADRYRALASIELSPGPSSDTTATLQRIVDVVSAQLPASGGASIIVYDVERDRFTRSVSTIPGQQNDGRVRVRQRGGATRWIVERGEPVVVGDLSEDPFSANPALAAEGLGAYVGMPLFSSEGPIGVLYVMEQGSRRYTEQDLAFLRAVADRAATAIVAARTRTTLTRALARATILHRVSVDLIATSDPSELATRAMAGLTDGLGVPVAALVPLVGPLLEGVARLVVGPEAERVAMLDLEEAWDALGEVLLTHSPGPIRVGDDPLVDPFIEALGGEALLVIPVEGHGVRHAVILLVLDDAGDITEHDLPFAVSIANELALATENASLIAELRRRAGTDALTGVANRARFQDLAEREHQHAIRRGTPLSVLIADIDHFKLVNDTHGHAIGDEVLREVAQRIGHGLRTTDVLARVGGEEFAALLPDTGADDLAEVAERVRAVVAERPIPSEAGEIEVRISVGGETVGTDRDVKDALRVADRRLYQAKAAGRDRAVVS